MTLARQVRVRHPETVASRRPFRYKTVTFGGSIQRQ
jgi:hypothetical protein